MLNSILSVLSKELKEKTCFIRMSKNVLSYDF